MKQKLHLLEYNSLNSSLNIVVKIVYTYLQILLK